MKSDSIAELAKALAAAQGEIEGATKGARNPHGGYNYADLASIWAACRGPLTKNGLAVTQVTEIEGDNVALVTTLLHISGQWIASRMPVKIAPMFDRETKREKPWTPQAFGSAITYARKYSLAAIVGVSSEDDDGEAASGEHRPAPAARPAAKPGNGFKIATPEPAEPTMADKTYARALADLETPDANLDWWLDNYKPHMAALSAVQQQALRDKYAAAKAAQKPATMAAG